MAHPPNAVAAALEAVRQTTAAQTATIAALEHAFDAEMALLASDRRALEDDRAAFIRETEDKVARDEEEKARINATAPPPDELVKLNVRGARFETSRAVLTKVEDSMLGRMFGRCDAMLRADPSDGSIFIDRDGERFGMLLDFLRGDPPDGYRMQRTIRALPEAAQQALVQELDYFGLEDAVFGLRSWTDDANFQSGPEMNFSRSWCAAVLAARRVMVFGGHSGESALGSTEVLDTRTMTFTAGPNMLTARYCHAAVQIDGNRVLLVGGVDDDDAVFNTTEIFHLETLTFTPGPNMQSKRCDCAAVALDARRFLVVGGDDGEHRLSSTEIFSLDTMAFTPGPAMATSRDGCAAVALDEHRIMVAGGTSNSDSLMTTEVLDERTMAFAPGPSMGSARFNCTAVHVDAEHVLIIGGSDSSSTALASTELLDVATMEFEPGPTMQQTGHDSIGPGSIEVNVGPGSIVAIHLDAAEAGPRILVLGGGLSTTKVLAVDAQSYARATRHRR